jgi:hypothetical protein
MSMAAQLAIRLGLHKKGTYEHQLEGTNDSRRTFAVCYWMEKWACLCHGVPAYLTWTSESADIVAGLTGASLMVYIR